MKIVTGLFLILLVASCNNRHSYAAIVLSNQELIWACDQDEDFKVGDTIDVNPDGDYSPARIIAVRRTCQLLEQALEDYTHGKPPDDSLQAEQFKKQLYAAPTLDTTKIKH